MSSKPHGVLTSQVQVTNVSSHGLWLLAHGEEFFLSYDDFPWFKEVTISSVLKVEEQSPGHFYGPDLDIDLGLETIEHPERFPLKCRTDT